MNKYYLCMFLSVTIASFSQIFLKKSAMKTHTSVIKEYLNPLVITGYAMLFGSMILTILAYKGLAFKNGQVIEALGNVVVVVLSYFILGEKVRLRKMIGIACILLGFAVFYL